MWSFKKPTSAGWYFVNLGDVVTDFNFECIKFSSDVIGNLFDGKGTPLSIYSDEYKYMPIGITSINQIGNKD